jgi:cob(I)alamin adenosyltransferase
MKIYTKTGDDGETGLFGGTRVRKNDPRVEAYGTIDELNAILGVVRSTDLSPELHAGIRDIQNELFVLGAEVACVPEKLESLKMKLIDESRISALEALIDENEQHLPPLTQFILPDGSHAGAFLHLARTVARRAERHCLDLELRAEVLIYLNRLSDCLFVLARRANLDTGARETPWKGRASS